MNKLTIDQIELKGKRVLVRVDFNVPIKDGKVSDDTRIVASLPTIKKIISDGGKAILMSHLGRPKGERKPEFSLAPVAKRLSELLGQTVPIAPDCIGEETEAMAAALKNGDCLLLENVRFHSEETKNDSEFAKKLAKLGDVYVNDAFGSAHRAHASTEGVTKYLSPCVAGFLMQKELDYLGKALANPARPFVAILGGAKISGKIDVIENLLSKVDELIIGGGMAYTFFKAEGGKVGKSLVEVDKINLAYDIIKLSKSRGVSINLPQDSRAAAEIRDGETVQTFPSNSIPDELLGVDIGPKAEAAFARIIEGAKTIVWNGPMGIFETEAFGQGTRAIAEALVKATKNGATTIVGGGDSAAAIAKYGFTKDVSHVSTGGGASLEFLEGKVLPGVAALTDA
ncbi:phosphoglycerate kinase [bacterium]|nr:phosphoglycerate kinase [bacterium]